MRLVLMVLVGSILACGSDVAGPAPTDYWGAQGIEFKLLSQGADLQLECRRIHIPQVIEFDSRGGFGATGALVSGGTPGEPVYMGGQVTGDTMNLNLALPTESGLHLDASFVLLHGNRGTFDTGQCAA